MKPPRQTALFADGDDIGTGATLVAVVPRQRPLSTTQRSFNRLTEKIRRERENLAAWEAYTQRFCQRVAAELEPLEREFRDIQRRLVARLDALLTAPPGGERLTRNHRAKARFHMLEIIDDLLRLGPDPELEALCEKHGGMSREERGRQEMDVAEALLGEVFGAEAVEGHDARDVEDLLHQAGARFAEQAQAEVQRREQRAREKKGRRPGGEQGAAEKKAQARREAGRSLREIYRRLASALHPDREVDAAERERKTALMQRANRAYQNDDLLELLTLQIEIEQIDAEALADVPEERLRHYIEVLREQLDALEAQTGERVMGFRMDFDLPGGAVTPQHVDTALSAKIAEARAARHGIETDLTALDDPRRRRSLLDTLPAPGEELGLDDLAEIAALFAGVPESPRASPRRRGKRGKRTGK